MCSTVLDGQPFPRSPCGNLSRVHPAVCPQQSLVRLQVPRASYVLLPPVVRVPFLRLPYVPLPLLPLLSSVQQVVRLFFGSVSSRFSAMLQDSFWLHPHWPAPVPAVLLLLSLLLCVPPLSVEYLHFSSAAFRPLLFSVLFPHLSTPYPVLPPSLRPLHLLFPHYLRTAQRWHPKPYPGLPAHILAVLVRLSVFVQEQTFARHRLVRFQPVPEYSAAQCCHFAEYFHHRCCHFQ